MNPQSESKHRVFLSEVGDSLPSVLKNGLEFIQWDKLIPRMSRVFVKPNFTHPDSMPGVTTNPEVLKSLLQLLKSRTDNVTLGESDGGNRSFRAQDSFRGHGMDKLCRELGVKLVNLSDMPSVRVEEKVLGKKVGIPLPRLLLEDIDCFITVPVLKVHSMTTVTLSLKNSWGCVPDAMRGMHHQDLSRKLALIAQKLSPKIVVVDGTYALNKHGPMFGEVVKANLLVVADNTVAADALGTRLMGFKPEQVSHILTATRAGLGPMRYEDVLYNQDWQPFKRHFTLERTLIERLSVLHFKNDMLAKLIFQSPFTPLVYGVASLLRTSEEKKLVSQINNARRKTTYW